MKGIIFNSEMVSTVLDTGVLEYRKAIKLNRFIKNYCVRTSSINGVTGAICYHGVDTKRDLNPMEFKDGVYKVVYTEFSHFKCPFGKIDRR